MKKNNEVYFVTKTSFWTSTVKLATQEQILNEAELHAQGECPHNCVIDTPGWVYDTRRCATCGVGLGTV